MANLRVTKKRPDSVGVILREEFLVPYGLTQDALARAMGVTRTVINEIVNERRGVTVDTAIMLSRVFKNTPEFWLNIQRDNNLWRALHNARKMEKFRRVVSVDRLLGKATTAQAGCCKPNLGEQ